MGFLDTLRKIIMGQPVFTPQSTQQEPIKQGPPEAPGVGKALPQVMIERWQCVPSGNGLHAELLIRNYSQGGVVLQRIELLGLRDELGNHIEKGETYEFVFNLTNRPNSVNLDECRLYFKNDSGDYFMALHQVEFDKLPDGTYNVRRFRLLPPIRDV